jgi:hypothetical protein
MPLQVNVMMLSARVADCKTGAGTVSTLTSSNPNAAGTLSKSNSSVVLTAVAETPNCRLVQPKAPRSVCA